MQCPAPNKDEIDAMIGKVNDMLTKATETQGCDADCQQQRILDSLKTNFEESTNDYTTCESRYNAAEKDYIVAKYGITYYNEQQDNEKRKLREDETQKQIDVFLKKVTETNSNFDTLKNDVNHLNLIQDLYKNTGVNKTLYDVFGISISPFDLEGFRTLETINQEIKFLYEKNQTGKRINRFLYIIYYILCVLLIIYLFFKKKYSNEINIGIGIVLLILPLLSIVKFIVFLFSKLRFT
jgi:hypothetical protein